MRLLSLLLLPLTALLLQSPTPAAAQGQAYRFDKFHTLVYFMVDRQGYTTMIGQFLKHDGTIQLDEDEVGKSKVTFSVDTSSVFTSFDKRDDKMRSPDFFNSKEFPTMNFKSTKIERTGEKTARMTGDLTIIGVTNPVTLDVTLNKIGVNARTNKKQIGFSLRGTLDRSKWGMNYTLDAIGREVTMMVEVLAHEI